MEAALKVAKAKYGPLQRKLEAAKKEKELADNQMKSKVLHPSGLMGLCTVAIAKFPVNPCRCQRIRNRGGLIMIIGY